MLTDEHINLAQSFPHNQFPTIGGFQNSLLSQNDGMIPERNEAIQIHFVEGNHWVTSTSIGGTVKVFDSKNSSKMSSTLTHQLALVYRTLAKKFDDGSELCIDIPMVQERLTVVYST